MDFDSLTKYCKISYLQIELPETSCIKDFVDDLVGNIVYN